MATLIAIVMLCIEIVFDFYILLLLLRLLLTFFQINFYNPISHSIFNFTYFFVKPLQRIIPVYKRIDFATLIVILLFEYIKLILLVWLRFDNLPGWIGLLPWGIGEILNLVVNIFFYGLLIRAILSWAGATIESPFYQALYILTEPLLRPVRRFIPPIGGFDFSAVVVAIILKAIDVVLIWPIIHWGQLHSLSAFIGNITGQ